MDDFRRGDQESAPGANEIMTSSLVNNKYRITRRIGGGSFGEIYMALGPANEKVAVKFERHGTRCPQLRHEYKVYREVASCHGFCRVHHFGTQDNYNVMVMDLLGPSLEDLFNKCARKFSLKTVLQLADQLLERVDTLHARHLIHRDIKPANFVIGLSDQSSIVYCVDFGLSKRYRHPKNLQHIPHRDGRSLTGTPRYASINNHLGIEQSRRDDLESIGYVLVYFLKGSLPWQGLKAKNAQKKYRLILEKKQQISIAQLCQGCPSQFAEYLAYTRSLKFDAKPDVPYLRKLFRDLYVNQGCGQPGTKLWDWDSVDTDHFVPGPSDNNPNTTGPISNAAARMDITNDDGFGLNMTGDSFGGDNTGRGDGQRRALSATQIPATGGAKQPGGVQWGFGNAGRPSTADAAIAGGTGGGLSSGLTGPSPAAAASGPYPPSGNIGNGAGVGNRDRVGSTGALPSTASINKRPHTAHGPSRGNEVGPAPPAADPRKSMTGDTNGSGIGLETSGEEEAHVVAGARAMMRYRKTKPGTETGSGSGTKSWGYPGGGGGAGVSGNPTTLTSGGVDRSGPLPQQLLRDGSSGSNRGGGTSHIPPAAGKPSGVPQQGNLPKKNVVQQSGGGGVGWTGVGNAGGGVGGTDSQGRPKSAGMPSAGVGSGTVLPTSNTSAGGGNPSVSTGSRGSTGIGVANKFGAGSAGVSAEAGKGPGGGGGGAGGNNNYGNTLSYGSLKNRFLSGPKSKSGGGSSGVSAGANGASGAGGSKLFSLSR